MKTKFRQLFSLVLTLFLVVTTAIPTMAGQGDLYYTGLRDTLNSIPLEPKKTGYEELDNLVADILSQIITEDMDTHDKLKACYDYLIDNVEYGKSSGDGLRIANSKESNLQTAGAVYRAYDILKEHRGVCDHYAAAFMVMARAIGVEMNLVNGKTHTSDGDFTGHTWVELTVGRQNYIFDAQVESNILNATGDRSYVRFGGITELLSDKYIKSEVEDIDFEGIEDHLSEKYPNLNFTFITVDP